MNELYFWILIGAGGIIFFYICIKIESKKQNKIISEQMRKRNGKLLNCFFTYPKLLFNRSGYDTVGGVSRIQPAFS